LILLLLTINCFDFHRERYIIYAQKKAKGRFGLQEKTEEEFWSCFRRNEIENCCVLCGAEDSRVCVAHFLQLKLESSRVLLNFEEKAGNILLS
jgi:hypothetical protein